MTMQLLEALTILAAGNCGELNYSANDETRAIFSEARRVVGNEASTYVDARLLNVRKPEPRAPERLWSAVYHKDVGFYWP